MATKIEITDTFYLKTIRHWDFAVSSRRSGEDEFCEALRLNLAALWPAKRWALNKRDNRSLIERPKPT